MGRLGHTLSTLRPGGYPARTQDSLPAVGQTLPGGLFVPLGSSERFLRCFLHRFPPFPGFPWRKRASVRPEARGEDHAATSLLAARHRHRDFGRKRLNPGLTTIVVNATISSCSTSKSSM